jgi:cytolysin-activating lysine-acyltransferase
MTNSENTAQKSATKNTDNNKSHNKESFAKYSAGTSVPKISIPNIDTSSLPKGDDTTDKTFATVIGEITWLLTQSPLHKHLAISDLEWMLMPPVLLNQFKIYHNEDQPVGVALWGYLSPEAEQRLKAASRIAPQDWGNGATLDPEEGMTAKEGGTLWLIELISPFNDEKNNHQQQMLADLMQTRLKGEKIKLFQFNPEKNMREELVLG